MLSSIHSFNYRVWAIIFPDGSEKIVLETRSLEPIECYCGHIEKEALPIMFAIRKFYKMLCVPSYPYYQSQTASEYFCIQERHSSLYSGVQCWVTILLDYDICIKYQLTNTIDQANDSQCKQSEELVVAVLSVEVTVNNILVFTIGTLLVTLAIVCETTIIKEFHCSYWSLVYPDWQLQPF